MNILVITLISIITIITIRKFLEKFPGKYFSIQDIVTTNSHDINFLGFVIRFGSMFFYSFIVAIIYNGKIEYVIEYGVMVSFLLLWPFVLHTIIFKNTLQEENFGYVPKEKKYIAKYITVYIMYSFLAVWICMGAVPIYQLIHGNPSLLYNLFLKKFLNLDLFQQGLVTNLVSSIVWFILGLLFSKFLHKYLKKNESTIGPDK